jgi:hypothetical protein
VKGLITTVKGLLEDAVREACPEIRIVVSSGAQESKAIMGRKLPFAALITEHGKFDNRTAQMVRYADEADNSLKQRYVRGTRQVPVMVRVWAENEEKTDELFSRLVPRIPRVWEYDGFGGRVLIEAEEHSDFVDNVSKLYLSVLRVQFAVQVAGDEEVVPTFTSVNGEPDMQPAG